MDAPAKPATAESFPFYGLTPEEHAIVFATLGKCPAEIVETARDIMRKSQRRGTVLIGPPPPAAAGAQGQAADQGPVDPVK